MYVRMKEPKRVQRERHSSDEEQHQHQQQEDKQDEDNSPHQSATLAAAEAAESENSANRSPATKSRRYSRKRNGSSLGQIGTLMWKHCLEEVRQPIKLLAQCCIPIAVICVLVLAHAVTNKQRNYSHCFFQPKALPTSGVLSFFQTKLCDWNSTCLDRDHPVRGSDLQGFKTPESLIQMLKYANENEQFNDLLLQIIHRIQSNESYSLNDLLKIASRYSGLLYDPEFQGRLSNLTGALSTDYAGLTGNSIFKVEADAGGISKVHIALYNLSAGVCGAEATEGNFDEFMSEAGIDKRAFLRDRRDVVTLDFSSTRSSDAASGKRRRRRRSLSTVDSDPTQGNQIFAAFRRYYDCHRYKDFSLWNTPLYNFWRLYNTHYYGHVLYAPTTPTVNKIIEKARSVFHSVQEVQDFVHNWNSTYRSRVNQFLREFLSHEESARHLCKLLIKPNNSLCDTIDLNHWLQAVRILDLLLPELDTFLSCYFRKLKDPFVGFANMSLLWRSLPNYTSSGELKSVLEFHVSQDERELVEKPGFIKYTLHSKAWFTDHPDDLRELKEPNNPGPRRHWTDVKFLVYSYADTQDIVEWAISEVLTGARVRDGVYMQMQPYMCWLYDEFFNTFRNFLHFFLIISWVVLVGVIVQKIVYEKESRLKEMILVMGVSREILWLAWFLSSLGIFLVPTLVASIVLKVTICRLVSFTVVFFTLLSYSVLSIVSAFFLSTLFSRANVGATLSSFIYLLTYIPYAVCKLVLNLELHPAGHFILSLLPNVAFAYTFDGILKFEHFSVPVYWSTLQRSPYVLRNFTVAGALAMMWLDSALLLLATAYVEQIHSGTRGASKSWYFLCSARFWKYLLRRYFTARPRSRSRRCQRADTDETVEEPPRQPDDEEIPIAIQRLCKTYGRHRVLKDFNLSLYRNQLTSLVGKNGCGKSTLMSILCGLDSASSGHVTMFGHSHPEELGSIRQWIGVCPQFDTVFGFLTVKEHVDFYGSLKGLTKEERCGEVDEIVHLLSLPEDTQVNQLSGGQRRKLSLLLAFLGQVKFVILDEPTAGVDPISRHAIWALIQRLKVGKTILMTSHHLDEAEALADRIAVLGGGGKIHFHDTPGKLKRMFSDSQMLTVSFVQGADCRSHATQLFQLISACAAQGTPPTTPASSSSTSSSSSLPAAAAASHLDGQKRGNDLYFRIPNSVAQHCMTEVLKCIETEKSRYQILRFQISQPTMEDIFFLIAGGEGEEDAGDTSTTAAAIRQPRRRLDVGGSGGEGGIDDLSFIRTDFPDGLALPTLPEEGGLELSDPGVGGSDGGAGLQGAGGSGVGSLQNSRLSLVPDEAKDDAECRRPKISRCAQLGCQVEALFLKRLRYMIRTPSCLLTNICLPILFLAVAVAMIQLRPGWRSSPPVEIHPWHLKNGYPNPANSLHYFFDYPDDEAQAAGDDVQPPAAGLYAEQLNRGFQGCRCTNSSVHSIPGYPCRLPAAELNDTDQVDQSCNACSFYCQPVDFPHQTRRQAIGDIAHKLPRNGSHLFNISNWLIQTSNDYLLNRFGGASFNEVNPLTDAVARARDVLDRTVNQLRNATLRQALKSSANLTEVVRFIDEFYGRRWSSKVWFDNIGYIAAPAYLNVFNNARLRALLPDQRGSLPTSGIVAYLESLPPDGQGLRLDFDNYGYMMALVGILIALSLSAFPCSSVCLLVEERSSGAMHLQKLFTVPLWLYWLVNFLYDLVIYTCIATVVTVTLHLLGGEAFHHAQDAMTVAILCWSYGLAALPMNYLLSLFFSEQSRAYISLFALNLLLSILTCLLYSIVYVLQQYNPPLRQILPTMQQALLITCPQFGIAEGIYTVQTNYFLGKVLEEWYGQTGVYKNLLSYHDGLLKNATYFAGHSLLFWLVIVLIECLVYRVRTRGQSSTDDASQRPNIEVQNVSKRYGSRNCLPLGRGGASSRRLAVDDVSFSVSSGEVLGLLGSNGAGKSSIFRMLTRCESITSGFIRVNGRPNDNFDCFANAGYCSQSNVLWKTMSPIDHLAFYARCKGFRGQALRREVDSLIDRLGLSENAAKPSSHLSGGNRRRLCVAIAFIGSPDVVLLDEPTAGVDVVARRRIWQCIQRARRMQQSILLTSHSMEECELLCNRILIMKSGKVLAKGSVDELVKQFCQGFVLRLLLMADAAAELTQTIVRSLADELGLDGSCVFKTDERDETKEVHILLKSTAGLVAGENNGATSFVNVYDALRRLQCCHGDAGFVSFALVHPSVEEVFHRVMSLADEDEAASPQQPTETNVEVAAAPDSREIFV